MLSVGAMATIFPASVRMLMPGLSLPVCVSTIVTPSKRSLPATGISATCWGNCLRHPRIGKLRAINMAVCFRKDRDIETPLVLYVSPDSVESVATQSLPSPRWSQSRIVDEFYIANACFEPRSSLEACFVLLVWVDI
jgi:hypothetical protein